MPVGSIDRFAAAAGTFTAGLLAPLAVVAVVANASVTWTFWLVVLLVVTGFFGGFVGARATVTPRTAERFRGGWRVVAPFALAPLFLAAGFGVEVATALPSAAIWVPVVVGALLTFAGGLLLATESRSLYGTRLTNESDTSVDLPPERTPAQRRRQRLAGGVALALVVVFGGLLWYETGELSTMLIVALAPLTLLFDADDERAAVDAGLKLGDGVEPWDGFVGYRVTDDEVVLERGAWYRADVRIDRDRLDDEAALLALLDGVLPETS